MNHELFGKLKYKDDGWYGAGGLPAFAAVGGRPQRELTEAEAEKLAADLAQALQGLHNLMKSQFGDAGAKMVDGSSSVCGCRRCPVVMGWTTV